MIERLSNVVYWLSLFAGFCILAFGLVDSKLYGPWVDYGGEPTINWVDIAFYVIASALVVFIGWAIRYILSGKKTLKP